MSKIVIVDDSIDLLEVMKFFLEEKGYEVEIATSQQDLFSLLRSSSADLIILDVFLQGGDGREICKELRRSEEHKYLCILLFSTSPKALANAKKCGADGYIEKPFGLTDIVDKIESTLETCKDYQRQ
ncbi:MAG TPA: response regulator [Chitinophagaceae bacterium]|nr:response regulator [Chitinophagaceae bacterium]